MQNPTRSVRLQVNEQTPDFGCAAQNCEALVSVESPVPLCDWHLNIALAFVVARTEGMTVHVDTPHTLQPPPPEDEARHRQRLGRPGWVYFIRKDGLIKIGWSSQPDRRLTTLRPDEVLHLEPGTIEDERRCHQAFVHLRVRHEYFTAGADLLAFIGDLKRNAA